MKILVSDLLNLEQTDHALLFRDCQYPWEILPKIKDYLKDHLKPQIHGKVSSHAVIEGAVYIGEDTVVEPHVYIKGPVWIGKNCEIRQGAYLRENIIVGNGCVLGNSCEFKNSLLFNEVHTPHFNYIGDSVLGYRAHLGAGVILSNFKITGDHVKVEVDGKKMDTGLRKFGAILGDHVEVGCQSVLNPGSIIGRHSLIYPGVIWRGICASDTIIKLHQEQVSVVERPTII